MLNNNKYNKYNSYNNEDYIMYNHEDSINYGDTDGYGDIVEIVVDVVKILIKKIRKQ